MKVFEALDLTQRALTLSGAFENDDDEDENETFVVWKSFANTLLAWASQVGSPKTILENSKPEERLFQLFCYVCKYKYGQIYRHGVSP
jgi:hypothetical protein